MKKFKFANLYFIIIVLMLIGLNVNAKNNKIDVIRKKFKNRGFIEYNSMTLFDKESRKIFNERYEKEIYEQFYTSIKIDNIKYQLIFYYPEKYKTNFIIITSVEVNRERYYFYKINVNMEKGKIRKWFDLNGDEIKQDDEIFYIWY